MSDFKVHCPGCGDYSSAIGMAFSNGDPCPTCGLSAAALAEITSVRATHANDAVKAEFEKLCVRADLAESRVALL